MKYDTEQIEQYLNGKLTAADAKAFESRMNEDKDFAYEVELHQTAIETVQYAVLRERTANIRREMAPPVVPIRRRVMSWRGLAVVAPLLLIFLIRFLMPSSQPASPTVDETFIAVLSQINDSDTTLGIDTPTINNTDSIYQLGITYVNQEKYTEAHREFDLLTEKGEKRLEATFNKAYAYWKVEENEAAKQQLRKILNDENATKRLKEKSQYIINNIK